jgi:arylsulfatase A-like enzyme
MQCVFTNARDAHTCAMHAFFRYSKSITSLANEGVILTNHYVHWHCSPTRRSFLTGRLPIHHGEMLSGDETDDIDLRWNLISQKLAAANCACSSATHARH